MKKTHSLEPGERNMNRESCSTTNDYWIRVYLALPVVTSLICRGLLTDTVYDVLTLNLLVWTDLYFVLAA